MSQDRAAGYAMDVTTLAIAAVQTGFGAFVAGYLAMAGWTAGAIGAVLTVQTVAAMLFQMPAGVAVDRATAPRGLLAGAVGCLAAAALLIALWPAPVAVGAALVLQSLGAAVLVPGVLAISLVLVGPAALNERLGRNARFAGIGSGAAAAIMALVATLWSERLVFLLAAGLAVPALLGIHHLVGRPPPPPGKGVRAVLGRMRPRLRKGRRPERMAPMPMREFLRHRRRWAFAGCVVLFHAASAAVLMLAAADVARGGGQYGGLFIGAFILVPQLVVAAASPAVGRAAQSIGRQRVLLLGFATLPLRAIGFAMVSSPALLIPVQLLEGLASAIYGVMLPLMAAGLTIRTGRTNLYLGALGLCSAGGAALSTLLAGIVAQHWGKTAAYWMLAGLGLAAVALVGWAMPDAQDEALADAPAEREAAEPVR